MIAVSSSRLTHIGYDEIAATVHVRFKDGTPWRYFRVPAHVWRVFLTSASKGRFIHDVLDRYPNGRG